MTFSASVFCLMVIVLSMDAYTAGLSYGIEKVRVPFLSAFTASLISGLMLTISLRAGKVLLGQIPLWLTHFLSFAILFLIALYKFYESLPFLHHPHHILTTKVITKKVNKKHKEYLSFTEALLLASALSVDNISAGFCLGDMPLSFLLTLIVTTWIHLTAMLLGIFTGKYLFRNSTHDLSWLGGVILLLLAFLHLF